MTIKTAPGCDPCHPDRRAFVDATCKVMLANGADSALPMRSPMHNQGATGSGAATRAEAPDRASLGARIQGVQHFGITVQNMDRAFEFYTEVLGGTEVARDSDYRGGPMHNAILLHEEIEAKNQRIDPTTIGVPDLREGAQRLDLRLVQFDNAVIELLQYRGSQHPSSSVQSFARPHDLTSPAYPRSMHVCFHVRDDVDFNQFIQDFEAECERRGM